MYDLVYFPASQQLCLSFFFFFGGGGGGGGGGGFLLNSTKNEISIAHEMLIIKSFLFQTLRCCYCHASK